MELLKKFIRASLVKSGFVPKPDFVLKKITDHPQPSDMVIGVIYVVGGPGYVKWAYFRCPADHDEIIQLSLMTKRRPSWSISNSWLGIPTVHPSVRQLDGSYAHFWIKDGKVNWCGDTGRKTLVEQSSPHTC